MKLRGVPAFLALFAERKKNKVLVQVAEKTEIKHWTREDARQHNLDRLKAVLAAGMEAGLMEHHVAFVIAVCPPHV